VSGTLGVTGIATFTDDIIIGDGKTIGSASDIDAITIASNGQVTLTQTLIGTALDISGNIDVDGTTNLDVVDIDGAVNMATTALVTGVLTANGGAVFNEDSADVDFRVESNGNANMLFVDGGNDKVYIGRNVGDAKFSSKLQIEGLDGTAGINLHRASADSGPPYLAMSKSRAAALGDDTVVQNGDGLGTIFWSGADGTDRTAGAASIAAEVDGTPGDNDMPGRLTFHTTADGAQSPTERMRIDSSGNVDITTGNLKVRELLITTKSVDLTTTLQDLIQVGNRASYKITVSVGDGSGGGVSGFNTAYVTCSNDTATQGNITQRVGSTMDLAFKASSGTSADAHTLQARVTSGSANQCTIMVETLSRYVSATSGTGNGQSSILL